MNGNQTRPDEDAIRIVLPRAAISYNAMYSRGRGRCFLTAEAKKFQHELRFAAPMTKLTGLVSMVLDFVFPNHIHRDIDNLAKPLIDALKNVIFEDDNRVQFIHMRKQTIRGESQTSISAFPFDKAWIESSYIPGKLPWIRSPVSTGGNSVVVRGRFPFRAFSVNQKTSMNSAGVVYSSAASRKFQKQVTDVIERHSESWQCIDGPVRLFLHFKYADGPYSDLRKFPKFDLDNLCKVLIDSMKDKLFGDDYLIDELVCLRSFGCPDDEIEFAVTSCLDL